MHHHAAAGLLDRVDDGVQIQRPQAAQVDDLGVDAGFLGRGQRHVHRGAVGQHGQRVAGPHDGGRIQRHGVVAGGHHAARPSGPGRDGPVVMAVEGAVVQALGFQEDHRIIVLDGGDQQALGVVGVGRHDRAQAADLREHGLGALAVGLAAVDAAAAGHADRHRRDELVDRAVAQARRLGHDLVGSRIEVVGELDLAHRPQAVGAHAHRHADDAALGDRRVEHARAAVLGLQAFGAAEHAAEIAHVLAEHHHVVVALQHHIHGRAQSLDHGHRRGRRTDIVVACHDQTPSCWRCRRRCSGMSLYTSSKMLAALGTWPSTRVP